MKIKDKVTKQIFNVYSQSIINQMLLNPKRYVEIKEQGNSNPVPDTTLKLDENKEEEK